MISHNVSAGALRRDIEGLRAIAILAVILNHARPSALNGGFAGVDIFFVISGYLIGMHLLQDIQTGRFSFLGFYRARARRLFPALIVMLLAVWVAGWLILSAKEFTDLGKHITAAGFFASNILLRSQSGYFAAPSASKPLLHLWSLGLEEQFYLVVPLVLWLSAVGRQPSIKWVLRLSTASLVLAMLYPVPSFYLLDTRFWELGVGIAIGYLRLPRPYRSECKQPSSTASRWEFVVLAIILMFNSVLVLLNNEEPWDRVSLSASCGLVVIFASACIAIWLSFAHHESDSRVWVRSKWQRQQRRVCEIASMLGLVLIGISLTALESRGWPGPQTVFPVMGAALFIMGGPDALANRALAIAPLVFIGGISYPLYLWHWPAMVYWRLSEVEVNVFGGLEVLVCAGVLAWLTKEFVEKPVRFGELGVWRFHVPPAGAVVAGLLIVCALGASTVVANGFSARFSPELRAVAAWSMPLPDVDWRAHRCFFGPNEPGEFAPECTPPSRQGEKQVLLWGDSHAAHLYPGLTELRSAEVFVLDQWTSAACPPTRIHLAGEGPLCDRRRAVALRRLLDLSPDVVLLSADWERYIPEAGSDAAVLAATQDAVHWLQQIGVRRIVLFGPGPKWKSSESEDLFMFMLRKQMKEIPERLGGVSDRIRRLDAAMAVQADAEHIQYVSIIDKFCDATGCLVQGNARLSEPDLLYRDQAHLTPSGSRLLISEARPFIFDSR